MHAEPFQALEYDAALAQKIVRDDGLCHIGEGGRRGVNGALQHRAALGDEHDNMSVRNPLHAFDEKLGGDRVDEIGEQDDEGTALEPRVELGETQGKVGLLMMVSQLGGGALDAGKAR